MQPVVIKYIGSKRRLVPLLGELFSAAGARRALDLFTGTTRVAQEFKRRHGVVTAVDTARYSEIFARCYIETPEETVDGQDLLDAIRHLNGLPGQDGYVTEVFCRRSRYFQPANGERIDAVRDAIEQQYRNSPLFPILLTSLIEAADRVDSTTGVQMAYVKEWSARSFQRLELRAPPLLAGPGRAIRGDAASLAGSLGSFDLAYLDPPYNQHRYFTNYHIWETLVVWDAPEAYGVACKRIDSRDASTKSVFNAKRMMPVALGRVIGDIDARIVLVSYNDESWLNLEQLEHLCQVHGHVAVLAFDSKRYVGAQIGIYNPSGDKVGQVSKLRNVEYVLIAGPKREVLRLAALGRELGAAPAGPTGTGALTRGGGASSRSHR